MQQYFVEQCVGNNTQILLNEEQAHHIRNVMRMRESEQIRIVDHGANIYMAYVHYDGHSVFACILFPIEDTTRNKVRITLLQGMIKKEKWDFLLQKSAELGVDVIVPFISSRTVIKTKEERQDKQQQRWNKILQEGCEQCKRSTLVDLKQPCAMKEVVQYKSTLNLIAYEDADIKSEQLFEILQANPNVDSVSIAIGSEGGFSKEEVAYFCEHDFYRVSLGSRILRAETAALSSVNSISFFYEMEGGKK